MRWGTQEVGELWGTMGGWLGGTGGSGEMGMGEGQCPHVPLHPHVPYATLYPQYPRGSPCPYLAPCFPMSPHTVIPLCIPRVSRSPPSASVSASGQHRMWLWGSCSPPWQSSMTTTSQVGGASVGGARGGGVSVQTPPSAPPSSALHRLLQRPPQEQRCGHPLLPESLRMCTRWAPCPQDPGDPPPKGPPHILDLITTQSWGPPHWVPPPHTFVGFKGAAGVWGG